MPRQRIAQLVLHGDVDAIECLFGWVLLGWGVQLSLPGATFSGSRSFSAMAVIAPEPAWGALFLAVGGALLGARVLGWRRVRIGANILASSLWWFVMSAFGLSNPSGTGVVVYAAFAVASSWIVWRLQFAREWMDG